MNNFYITTPIYYVNDKPHIGHFYTNIACDIISRYQKLNNNDVYFLTGTDEHGQKVEKAAKKNSIDTKEFVDKMSKNFKELIDFSNCNINDFIRTTDDKHIKAAQALWTKMENNNQIYLSNYEGWYSVRDEAFYTENELTKSNNSFIAPSGSEVEWVKEESYFFKLSEWENKLLEYYQKNPNIIKPESRYNEVVSFIKNGLKDLSISRTTFNWGVPVPNNNKHVMYVWIDALCNYLTAIGYPNIDNKSFKKYWPGTHVVGKDILRFHAVYWPAFLMAADLEPPKHIFAHGWWTNSGEKISKSLGNVIDPYEIVSEYGLDQIRFFLFREVPFGNDGDFSKEAVFKRINSDLANNFGNLIQRVLSFVIKNCNSIVDPLSTKNQADKELIDFSNKKFLNYRNYMDNFRIDRGLKEIFELLSETNTYIDNQAPWNLKKNDIQTMKNVISISVEMIRRSTILLYPIMPNSCEKIFSILNLDTNNFNLNLYEDYKKISYKINNPTKIFPRIE